MKRLKKASLFTSAILVIAVQSCGLTGNNASKTASGLEIIGTEKEYIADIQNDSSNQIVSLTNYLQPFAIDWKYATTDNFTNQVLYRDPQAFLRLPAARALRSVQEDLAKKGIGLKLFDAYRPYSVTKKMWEIVPDERYAANPAKGSGHNRGIAVDLTIVDASSGKELSMPTAFDDFTEKAHHSYMQLDPAAIANRALLRQVMERHGFVALETEWWHYYLPDSHKYRLMNLGFDQLRKIIKQK